MYKCEWCGKQFNYDPFTRGSHSTRYCCGRCYNAAENARKKEQQRQKESTDEFLRQIGGGSTFVGRIVMVALFGIIAIAYLIFGPSSSNESSEGSTEGVQEAVPAQLSGGEESNIMMEIDGNQNTDIESWDAQESQFMEPDLQLDMENEEGVDYFEMTQDATNEEDVAAESNNLKIEKEDFSTQKVFDIVDEMPVFPGGDHELIKYIAENLEYPQEAMEIGIQGRVFVKIIVEPDGSISNAQIIRGIGYGCDEEAIRVIELMPNWEPGRKNGEVVRVTMAVPVNFKLQ